MLYTCTSGIVQDRDEQYVRLISSGQFVQRFDHLGLVFRAENGDTFERSGRLEVTAWPDHVVFHLDLSGVAHVTRTEIQLTSPSGKLHRSAAEADRVTLAVQPHLDQVYEVLDATSYVSKALDLKTGNPLGYRFDQQQVGLRIDLSMPIVKFPDDTNRVDEFLVEIRNPSATSRCVPLILNELVPQAITGTSMVLCEQPDGRPTGIPVQISKNWHRDRDQPHGARRVMAARLHDAAAGSQPDETASIAGGLWLLGRGGGRLPFPAVRDRLRRKLEVGRKRARLLGRVDDVRSDAALGGRVYR